MKKKLKNKIKSMLKKLLKKTVTKKNVLVLVVLAAPVIGMSGSPETQALLADHLTALLQMMIDAMPVTGEVPSEIAPTVG